MRAVTIASITLLLGLTAALPTQETASPSIAPEALSTATSSLSSAHLEIRQGVAVTAAPVAASIIPGQVSPITTVQIGYLKNGAYVQVQEVYTQTFALPVDQLPAATAGAIGLGTIAGEVGVVKTKRDVVPMETQLPTPQKEPLTLKDVREIVNEKPVENEREIKRADLVLTTAALNKLLAALPLEAVDGEKKRDVVLTTELLNKLVAKREPLTTEELDAIMASLPVKNK